MAKVVKFGGSSLASAEQFKKVGEIIRADKARKYVIPSAPGKRFKDDTKVTDMLYGCYELAENGKSYKKELAAIDKRYQEIIEGLGLQLSLDQEFAVIEKNFKDEGIDAAKIEDLRVDYILRWRKAIDATIAIVEYEVVTNYEGRRQANITLMNLSEKPINSFELKFSCRDGNGKLTTDSADHDGTITGWSKKANIAGYSKRTFGWVLANNSQTAYISDFEIKNVNEL